MTACYFLTNPRDSSISITGFPMGGTYSPSQPIRSSNRISSATASSTTATGQRYVPVLTVKRRAGPTKVSAPFPAQEDALSDNLSQNGGHPVHGSSSLAFGRPAPSVDCFQSRTPIAQKARNCSRSLGSGTFHKPLTDVRTGFMRTMSKPTPGELDLKHHQEKQALDKLKADLKREQAALDDPDKLDIKDIIRLVDERHPSTSSYAHRLRPRAAKRRVAHASLVAEDTQLHKSREILDRDTNAQTAISEYKHRLQALSSQMRSSRERTKSANARNGCGNVVDTQSLRLAPNYSDRLMSIQLLSLPDASGRTSPQGSLDEHSSRSFPMQSRLSPRSYSSLPARDAVSSSSSPRRPRHSLFPEPIYIPSANDDCDDTIRDGDARSRVRLSMRRSTNQTRETSLLSDMDPRNTSRSAGIASTRIVTVPMVMQFPHPTIPPTNTPVSDDGDLDGIIFDDDDSLATNWSSRSCSRVNEDFPNSLQSRSITPASLESNKKSELSLELPSAAS